MMVPSTDRDNNVALAPDRIGDADPSPPLSAAVSEHFRGKRNLSECCRNVDDAISGDFECPLYEALRCTDNLNARMGDVNVIDATNTQATETTPYMPMHSSFAVNRKIGLSAAQRKTIH